MILPPLKGARHDEDVALDRAERKHLAAAVDMLVKRHGTIVKAAPAIGLGTNTVSILRRGKRAQVSPGTLDALATAAGCTVDELLSGKAPPASPPPSEKP